MLQNSIDFLSRTFLSGANLPSRTIANTLVSKSRMRPPVTWQQGFDTLDDSQIRFAYFCQLNQLEIRFIKLRSEHFHLLSPSFNLTQAEK